MDTNKGLLNRLVDNIAVSRRKYEDAKNRYDSLSDWLKRSESSIKDDNPHIYTHGSFMLGTAVNPISGEEYDLDIMCCLQNYNTLSITQSDLKQKVGNEIVSYTKAHGMEYPEDKTRAWTINYSEKSQFHMDILPAIPSGNGDIVYIPYKDSGFYNQILSPWDKSSNPKGYVKWFRSISKENYKSKLEKYAIENRTKVEAVPKYTVRSTLQDVVILLKRHRDVFFENMTTDNIRDMMMMKKEKVSSIIVTTLAGMAYKQESDITEAFLNIVDRLEDNILVQDSANYIHFRYAEDFQIGNRLFKIVNPSNPDEEFTDKWRENPYKKMAFFAWLKQLKADVNKLKKLIYGQTSKVSIIYKMFGENIKSSFYDFLTEDIDKNEPLYLEKPKYQKCLTGDVKINGYCSDYNMENIETHNLCRYKIESNDPLDKNKHLLFVANTSISKPYEVIWQVSNKGRESVVNDQIRGEISKSETCHKNFNFRYQKREMTCYTGTHWVRCFIIKNGFIVAESEKFYVKVVSK